MKEILFIGLLFVSLIGFSQDVTKVESSLDFQNNLNKEFADKNESPLTEEDFKSFKTLDFFSINEKFIVEATLVKAKEEKVFKMKTSTSRAPAYIKYGEILFSIDGKKFKLNVYQDIEIAKEEGYHDYLFLPFSDLTSGKESYIGGRYIELRIPVSNTIIVDFNKAYNPYCAYNHRYSCPLVPLENDLDIEILAGVKKFHD